MLIQCPQCETTFKLDEKRLPAEGSPVRCSRCGRVFRAEPPAEELSAAAPTEREEEEKTTESGTPGAENDPRPLADEEEMIVALPGSPRKKFWSVLGLFVLLILLTVTVRYSYLQLKNPQQEFLEILKEVFFIPADAQGLKKIRLSEVKGYFMDHPAAGRLFVVEGKVTNGYADPRKRIRLRGTLQDASRRVVAQREVTAGWSLKTEELETQSLSEINRLQENPAGTSLPPGATAPFLIIFSPVAQPLAEFSVEVLESRKNATPPPTVR